VSVNRRHRQPPPVLLRIALEQQHRRFLPWKRVGTCPAAERLVRAFLLEQRMRYRARWSNGFWKTFDSQAFEDVAVHSTQVDAERHASASNSRRTAK
jgi:hypothetical protein